MIKRCSECDSKVKRLHDDPRSPPLEVDACLCDDCLRVAIEDVIQEHEGIIDDLAETLDELKGEV